jgi:hypothetical protein
MCPAMSDRSDVAALVAAGALALLAGADAELVLAPGARSSDSGLGTRAAWVAEHAARWQAGWAFWVPVLLAFAWGLWALARHLLGGWRGPAVGATLLATSLGAVGAVLAVAAVPGLARAFAAGSVPAAGYAAADNAVHALVDVAAAGLYALGGLLLLPAMVTTPGYPRALTRLAAGMWALLALAALCWVVARDVAPALRGLGLLLYAGWAWASAGWLARLSKP